MAHVVASRRSSAPSSAYFSRSRTSDLNKPVAASAVMAVIADEQFQKVLHMAPVFDVNGFEHHSRSKPTTRNLLDTEVKVPENWS